MPSSVIITFVEKTSRPERPRPQAEREGRGALYQVQPRAAARGAQQHQ